MLPAVRKAGIRTDGDGCLRGQKEILGRITLPSNKHNTSARSIAHHRQLHDHLQQKFNKSPAHVGFYNCLNLVVVSVREVRQCPAGISENLLIRVMNETLQRRQGHLGLHG